MDLDEELLRCLNLIPLVARRVLLDTRGVYATVPMLRGVWGRALHQSAPEAYSVVFEGRRPDGQTRAAGHGQTQQPLYVLRPAPVNENFWPAMDWIVFGPAIRHDPQLRNAWALATQMGLGPERRPFEIRKVVWLQPDGTTTPHPVQFALGAARWPMQPAADTPCRLIFPAPLRILRNKRLITRPALADIIAASVRRIRPLLDDEAQKLWNELGRRAVDLAKRTPHRPRNWDRLDLARYSGRQKAEVELHGVTGELELPSGPGSLWPLLLVASWLHIGKSTVMGLGEMLIGPSIPD